MHIIGIESLVPVLLTSPVVSQPEKLLPSSNLLTILLPQPLRLQPINALLNINPLPTANPFFSFSAARPKIILATSSG
jgi:hypothetical protein